MHTQFFLTCYLYVRARTREDYTLCCVRYTRVLVFRICDIYLESVYLAELIIILCWFQVCQPRMMDGTTCSDLINIGKYIEEFTCSSPDSNARMLKEMRLSFPSGHASFSAYTMIYCAVSFFQHCSI